MASPNKIKNVGYDYKPFQMKAAGPKYKNSPIEKNYGSPAQRGFDFTGGVGSKEMEGGVGSAFDYASPAKGWFSNIAKKVGSFAKKAVGGGAGLIGKALGIGKGGGAAETAMAGAGAAGGGVQPHGDEAHTGGDAAQTMMEQQKAKQGGKMWGGIGTQQGGGGKFGRMGIGGQAATAAGDLGSGQGPEIAEEEMV